MINLILALVWFATAGVLYFFNLGPAVKGAIPIPLSAAALILGIYNLMRWSIRLSARSQKEQGELAMPRRRLRRPGDDVAEPDANFVFTDPPPAGSIKPQGPAPPGTNGTGHETK